MVIPIKKSEPGVALLATLMAIALMTILVVDFTNSSALGYRSAANQANEIRAEYLARSGVNVGLSLLAQQARINAATQTTFYALMQPWALPYPPVAIDGGTAEVYIVDEARKFNINQLVNPQTGAPNPDAAMVVGRLCEILGIDPRIIPAIIDWLDPDSVDSPGGGAEADYYLRLNPPYEPRNGPMPTIGDLRMIRGIDTPTFMQLRQFLTVAPELRVNANTVAPELLAALSPQMASNPRLVKEIMIARMRQPFQNVTDISNLPGVGENSSQLMRLLNTTSNYFTINAVGTYAGARKFIFATFRCNPNGTAVLTSWNEQ